MKKPCVILSRLKELFRSLLLMMKFCCHFGATTSQNRDFYGSTPRKSDLQNYSLSFLWFFFSIFMPYILSQTAILNLFSHPLFHLSEFLLQKKLQNRVQDSAEWLQGYGFVFLFREQLGQPLPLVRFFIVDSHLCPQFLQIHQTSLCD